MKKTLKFWLVGLLVGILAGPSNLFAAASGNYTDLLPIGAAGNTTVISNGSGWSLTTLPPTQTFGDSLSRVSNTVYQSTSAVVWGGNAALAVSTFSALVGQGKVGSTTFPAAWVATGRSIRVTAAGRVTTSTGTFTWDILLGTTSIMNSGAVTPPGSQTDKFFKAEAILTIGATGITGSINGNYDIQMASGTAPFTVVSFSTMTGAAITVDLTSQLTVNPRFTWGSPTTGNSILFDNVLVEFLN